MDVGEMLEKRIPVKLDFWSNEGEHVGSSHIDLSNMIRAEYATITLDDWGVLANGSSGWVEIEQAWLREMQAIYEIFCEKQHDYGPKNIGIGGLPGLLTRMVDKVARWNEYIKKGAYKVPGENLEDTLQDIADYGVIALLVLHGHWPTFELSDLFNDDEPGTCEKDARIA